MSRFINTELKSDSGSDSDSSNLDSEKIGDKIWCWINGKTRKIGFWLVVIHSYHFSLKKCQNLKILKFSIPKSQTKMKPQFWHIRF